MCQSGNLIVAVYRDFCGQISQIDGFVIDIAVTLMGMDYHAVLVVRQHGIAVCRYFHIVGNFDQLIGKDVFGQYAGCLDR